MKKLFRYSIFLFVCSALFYGCSVVPLDYSTYENINYQKFKEINKNRTHVLIDLANQELTIKTPYSSKTYPISSSAYGIGSVRNSLKTPLGAHVISEKIGKGAKIGSVFRARKFTGEVVEPITERIDIKEDVITTRILWLDGLEKGRNKGGNVDSKSRYIYIHGTAEEGLIGEPASLGCIRMKNMDVIKLFNRVRKGTQVLIY
tara:strand:- start:162 stop:770 length:609 start_codon:yes stop_codon:yes gene_type:complete